MIVSDCRKNLIRLKRITKKRAVFNARFFCLSENGVLHRLQAVLIVLGIKSPFRWAFYTNLFWDNRQFHSSADS